MKKAEQHSLLKSIFLHLFPGVVITVVSYVLIKFVFSPELPKAVGFYAAVLFTMPVLFCLMIKIDGENKKVSDNIEYCEKTPLPKLILFIFISLAKNQQIPFYRSCNRCFIILNLPFLFFLVNSHTYSSNFSHDFFNLEIQKYKNGNIYPHCLKSGRRLNFGNTCNILLG